MRHSRFLIASFAAAAVTLTGCGTTETGTEPEAAGSSQTPATARDEGAVEVTMAGAQGADAGTVRLVPEGNGVRVEAELEGLEPGYHGFHVHDVGVCDANAPEGPFTTAMGHYVGGGGSHGTHDGDMPPLYARADGSASLTASLDTFTLQELTEGDGSAVMVHAGGDNFANIPDRYTSSDSGQPGPDEMTTKTGDAGARAACGVIEGA